MFKISRKSIKTILITVFIIYLIFDVFSYLQITNNYELSECISDEFRQTRLITFMASTPNSDISDKAIEIFDITKGEVIKEVRPNSSIQKIAVSYLNGISGMYVKVKAFPEKGYIIRIPFNPPVEVQNLWLTDYNINSVNEVFILLPDQGNPSLLVLDNRLRPLFYTFDGDVDILLKKLEFYPTLFPIS